MIGETLHYYKRPVHDSDPMDYETFCSRMKGVFESLNLSQPPVDEMWERYIEDTDFMEGRDYVVGSFKVGPDENPEDAFERVREIVHPDDKYYLIPDWDWPEVVFK